jgi:hypothetical protein
VLGGTGEGAFEGIGFLGGADVSVERVITRSREGGSTKQNSLTLVAHFMLSCAEDLKRTTDIQGVHSCVHEEQHLDLLVTIFHDCTHLAGIVVMCRVGRIDEGLLCSRCCSGILKELFC